MNEIKKIDLIDDLQKQDALIKDEFDASIDYESISNEEWNIQSDNRTELNEDIRTTIKEKFKSISEDEKGHHNFISYLKYFLKAYKKDKNTKWDEFKYSNFILLQKKQWFMTDGVKKEYSSIEPKDSEEEEEEFERQMNIVRKEAPRVFKEVIEEYNDFIDEIIKFESDRSIDGRIKDLMNKCFAKGKLKTKSLLCYCKLLEKELRYQKKTAARYKAYGVPKGI